MKRKTRKVRPEAVPRADYRRVECPSTATIVSAPIGNDGHAVPVIFNGVKTGCLRP